MTKLAIAVVVVLACSYALAQSRMDARPTVTPMGTSSSNGVSFAWFFDANNRTVHVCRTGAEVKAPLGCSAAPLP
jgi:hypothetical protein